MRDRRLGIGMTIVLSARIVVFTVDVVIAAVVVHASRLGLTNWLVTRSAALVLMDVGLVFRVGIDIFGQHFGGL